MKVHLSRRIVLEASREIVRFLRRADRPLKSDALFVFGSDRTCVADKAMQLFNRGFAPWVIFTGGTAGRFSLGPDISASEMLRNYAVERGMPEDKILIETESTNSMENIRFGFDILKANLTSLERLVLVSLPYQQLRQWATLERLKRDPEFGFENLKTLNCPANYPLNRIKDAETLKEDIRRVVGEVERILKYRGNFIIWIDVPPEVMTAYHNLKRIVDKW